MFVHANRHLGNKNELVSLLESRHLIVKDRERAKRKLESINYYRLSGYMLPYKKTVGGIISDNFRDGITWNKIINTVMSFTLTRWAFRPIGKRNLCGNVKKFWDYFDISGKMSTFVL